MSLHQSKWDTLTPAQQSALKVLVSAGEAVRGGKHKSRSAPVPRCVNSTAAFSLCRLGLAKPAMLPWASVFTSGYEFTATDEGRAVARKEDSR